MNKDYLLVHNFIKAHEAFFRSSEPTNLKRDLKGALAFYEEIEYSTLPDHKLLRSKLQQRFAVLLDKSPLLLMRMGLLQRTYQAVQNPTVLASALSHGFDRMSKLDKESIEITKAALELGGVPQSYSNMTNTKFDKPFDSKITIDMVLKLYSNIKTNFDAINLEDQYYGQSNTHALSTLVSRLFKCMLDAKQFTMVANLLIEDAEFLNNFINGLVGLGKYGFVSNLSMHNYWSNELFREIHKLNPQAYDEIMADISSLIVMHMESGTDKRIHLDKIPFSSAFTPVFCREACRVGVVSMRLRPEDFKTLNRWCKQQGGEDLAEQMAKVKEIKKLVTRYNHLIEKVLPIAEHKADTMPSYMESMAIIARNPVVLETLFIPKEDRINASRERLMLAFKAHVYASRGRNHVFMGFAKRYPDVVYSKEGVNIMMEFLRHIKTTSFDFEADKGRDGGGIAVVITEILSDKSKRDALSDIGFEDYQIIAASTPKRQSHALREIPWTNPRIRRSLLESDLSL